MRPAVPSGRAMAIPVPMVTRDLTPTVVSMLDARSKPASVECALTGSTASGCKRFICNDSKVFVSLKRIDPPCLAGPVLSKFESFASFYVPVVHFGAYTAHPVHLSVTKQNMALIL